MMKPAGNNVGLARQPASPRHSRALAAEQPQPGTLTGHVKKPDLLRMRPIEHANRLGRGLQ